MWHNTIKMNDTFWIYLVILLLGYAIGATVAGRRSRGAAFVVACPDDLGLDNHSGCGIVAALMFGGLLVLLLFASLVG